MKPVKLLLLVLLTFLCHSVFSQVGVTGYSIHALGINTSTNNLISVELKTFANRDLEDVLMEADVYYNFKPREYHRFSLGVGVLTQPLGGDDFFRCLTIPAQLEVFPLQEFKRLSVVFDLRLEIISEDALALRSLFGVRYTFGDK